jgi:hypothetical protein
MDSIELVNLKKETESLNSTTTLEQPWAPELVLDLTYAVLGFTILALFLATILFWKHSISSLGILKLYGILSIIGMSSILLVTGYDKDQLTPIVGLFGAIAGYLLGKESEGGHQPLQAEPPRDNK